MASFPQDWSALTTYAADDLANYNGVVYKALNSITGDASNSNPCEATANWIVSYVINPEDLNGIIESVKQELNIDNETINNSIPLYIKLAESSFYTRIRPPSNLKSEQVPIERITVPAGYEGRDYIKVPTDLLQLENMSAADESTSYTSLGGLGSLEIKAAATDYDFELLRSFYTGNDLLFGDSSLSNYSSPIYRFTTIAGVPYFEIAPNVYEVGTMIRIRYYKAEPKLATVHPIINAAGEAINAGGMTLAQWEAAGNPASTFVQATTRITKNWYTANAPHLLIYGALTKASSYLKDDSRAAMWNEQFKAAEAETIDLIYRFEEVRPTDLQMSSDYAY